MRRAARRYLTPTLLLLAPLLLLTLLGAAELSRQSERVEGLLREQAASLVSTAARRFEEELPARVHDLLDSRNDWTETPLARIADELAQVPGVLDLFLLDGEARMLFPEAPPPLEGSLPLATAPTHRALFAATLLEGFGDLEGASATLARFTADEPPPLPPRAAEAALIHAQAWFQRGGLERRLGRADSARSAYRRAAELAGDLLTRAPGRQRTGRDSSAILLLSEVALAELDADPDGMLALIRDVSEGQYDLLGDDLLVVLIERLANQIPIEAATSAELAELLQVDRSRRFGRRFAEDYRALLAGTLRLRLAEAGRGVTFFSYPGPEATSLLAVTPASPELAAWYGAEFIGLRLDVALLVNARMDAFLTPDENGFFLGIFDDSGRPLLKASSPEAGAEFPFHLPSQITLGGLELRAIPGNPAAILADRSATVRGRAWLWIALCLTTIGAGVLLLRSVKRESELAALKVELVSRVSHELKTPLSLIRMYAETIGLGRARGAEQTGAFASIIVRESDRLTAMVERILDFSRQESGTIRYVSEAFDLAAVVGHVTDQYRPHVASRGMQLEATLPPPLIVEADRGALENALVNLLENAVKYTPSGAADRTIRVDVMRRNGCAVIAVHDRGVGIPPDERERVFDSFYRATTAGEVRGAGLGLSLVRHFAQAHGGRVVAMARDGGGSTFELSLPLGPDGAEPAR
jgi:signal transduction histidine kinase